MDRPAEAEAEGHRPTLATVGPNGTVRDESTTAGVPEAEQRETAERIADGLPPATLEEYLVDAHAFLCRYVAWPSEHEPVAVALWAAFAQLVERFDVAPILSFTSAEKRSGKTRALEALGFLVPAPWPCVLPSDPVVFTMLSRQPRPTMLLDEADAIFGAKTAALHEGLRAILNSGYRRGVTVPRVNMEGKRRAVEDFEVFGAKAVAGIGELPDTVADRAIAIRMRRRSAAEPVAKLRERVARAEAASIVLDWDAVEVHQEAPVPDTLNDRAADSWEPLLATRTPPAASGRPAPAVRPSPSRRRRRPARPTGSGSSRTSTRSSPGASGSRPRSSSPRSTRSRTRRGATGTGTPSRRAGSPSSSPRTA